MVDADYALVVLHTDLVLDRAGNCNIDDHVGLEGGAGLADLHIRDLPDCHFRRAYKPKQGIN